MKGGDRGQSPVSYAFDNIGYTREDQEFMDEDERAEILEKAGIGPDDGFLSKNDLKNRALVS